MGEMRFKQRPKEEQAESDGTAGKFMLFKEKNLILKFHTFNLLENQTKFKLPF